MKHEQTTQANLLGNRLMRLNPYWKEINWLKTHCLLELQIWTPVDWTLACPHSSPGFLFGTWAFSHIVFLFCLVIFTVITLDSNYNSLIFWCCLSYRPHSSIPPSRIASSTRHDHTDRLPGKRGAMESSGLLVDVQIEERWVPAVTWHLMSPDTKMSHDTCCHMTLAKAVIRLYKLNV